MYNAISTSFKGLLFIAVFVLTAHAARATCIVTDSTITVSICSGDTFYVGTTAYTHTNTYADTLVNAGGCDSIVTLNLTVIQPVVTTLTDSICAGDTVSFYGSNLTASGNYTDTLTAFITGCDSIVNLNLTVLAPMVTNIRDTVCMGDTVYFNGHAYATSGTHKDTLTSVTGCDSIVAFNLLVRPALKGSISQSICRGGSYTFNGSLLTQPGTYKDTLTTQSGCDSVLTLTLNYTADVPHNISATICAGNSYIYNGDTLIYSGVYNDTLVASTGCDSLVVLTLNILPNPLEPFIVGSGDTLTSSSASGYQWLMNDTIIAGDTSISIITPLAGNYQVQITGQNGCTNTSAYYYQNALGVNVVKAAWDVRLYPNPNNGSFIIAFTDNVIRVVQITDALGRIIMADENVSGTKTYNLNGLAGGVYFVRIKQLEEVRTVRFVVAK